MRSFNSLASFAVALLACKRSRRSPPADAAGADDRRNAGGENMKTRIKILIAQRRNVCVVAAALLTAGAVGGWAMSAMVSVSAAAFEGVSRFDMRKADANKLPPDDAKPGLIGSYVVTGTDSDGRPYAGPGIVDVSLAPSGALELEWDNGKQVGVGEVIGNVLTIASLAKGRTAILMMNINPDGSLSGKWLRRTDRGYKGGETWKKI
jgi:hypothetical protein